MNLIDEGTATDVEQSAPILTAGSGLRCPECGGPVLPSALENGSGNAISLRCFVRKERSGRYAAECIDLDLGAESDTLDGAVKSLGDAIVGYLMVVLDGVETEQEAPAAVLRPSPLSHRLLYHFEHLKYRIASLVRSQAEAQERFYSAPFGPNASQCHV